MLTWFRSVQDPHWLLKEMSEDFSRQSPSPEQNSAQAVGTSDEAALNNSLYMQAALQNQAFQTQSAEKAMKFSAEQAALDRKFQAEMSNTAYQRSVADLKAAGLNPILAYTNGPASTPGGSSAAGIAAAGAQANVDTYDWESSKKNASANMLGSISSLIGNSAKLLDLFIPNYNVSTSNVYHHKVK